VTSLSLDSALNPRLFHAASQAGTAAAARWLDIPALPDVGEWNLLLDHVPPYVVAALSLARRQLSLPMFQGGERLWLGFRESQAGAVTEQIPDPCGAGIRACCEAFGASLRPPDRTLVMGVLNVTPDSFSDGGRWMDVDAAVARGLEMVDQGAHALDVGGESTRPGAEEVPAEEELRRVLPVVRRLAAEAPVPISIDTRKAAVAGPCLDVGAGWVNDVSGLTFDPGLAELLARRPDAKLVLMHSRSKPSEERYSTEWDERGPVYEDVVADTMAWLRRQASAAIERGVRPEQLWIDPGFGFGKTFEQNVELLRRLREYTAIGLPVLIGTSRKSSVGRLLGDLPASERLEGSLATAAWAAGQGAAAVRVHDVKEVARTLKVIDALR
jgi:dihydropteroate synthase